MKHCSRWALGVAVVIGFIVPRQTAAAAHSWSIAMCGPAPDPRRLAVAEAVEFWNGELTALKAKLSLGPITDCDRGIPDDLLRRISDGILNAGRGGQLPREFEKLGGDVV